MSRHDLKVLANIKAEVPLCFKTLGVSSRAGSHILFKQTSDPVDQMFGRAGAERDRSVPVHNACHGVGDTAEVDIRHGQPQLWITEEPLQTRIREIGKAHIRSKN